MGKYTILEKKLERGIDEISRKDLSGPSLEMLDKMAHTLKSLKTIDAMEGYSEDDGYHYDGMSYARGRGTYATGTRWVDMLKTDMQWKPVTDTQRTTADIPKGAEDERCFDNCTGGFMGKRSGADGK